MDTTMSRVDRQGKEKELGFMRREQQSSALGNANLSWRASTSASNEMREPGEQNVCFGSFRPWEVQTALNVGQVESAIGLVDLNRSLSEEARVRLARPSEIQDKRGQMILTGKFKPTALLCFFPGGKCSEEVESFATTHGGLKPVCVHAKADGSFHIKFAAAEPMAKLLKCQAPLKEGMYLSFEQWDPSRVIKPQEISQNFIYLTLPELPWECFELVGEMIKTAGEYVSGPLAVEELFATKLPTYGIKVDSLDKLPEGIYVVSIGEAPRRVFQMFDYPGLPARCKVCKSKEHLQLSCPVKAAEKMGRRLVTEIVGEHRVQHRVIPGGRLVPIWHRFSVQARKEFFLSLPPSCEPILKVGILLRSKVGRNKIWFPRLPISGEAQVCTMRMLPGISQDRAGLTRMVKDRFSTLLGAAGRGMERLQTQELLDQLDVEVVAHRIDDSLAFVYFVGTCEISPQRLSALPNSWKWHGETEELARLVELRKASRRSALCTKTLTGLGAELLG